MRISKTRINNAEKYLSDLEENQKFYIGIKILPEDLKDKLENNFVLVSSDPDIFTPKPYNGIVSQRNTVGEFLSDKTKPKETAYKSMKWTLKSWNGEFHSGISEVPYQTYPKIFVEPFGFDFTYREDQNIFVIRRYFINNGSENLDIKSAFNLILEIFKTVETFGLDENEDIIVPVNKTLPWEIIPKGEKVWNNFKNGEVFKYVSVSSKSSIKERFNFLEEFKPNERYEGTAGYSGYEVFTFKDKDIYVFDSVLYGNATYIFSGDWKEVSRLTKKQIIDGNLFEHRLVHNSNWQKNIGEILNSI